jgi:hypothetical protein
MQPVAADGGVEHNFLINITSVSVEVASASNIGDLVLKCVNKIILRNN